jgi:hypothetical protein
VGDGGQKHGEVDRHRPGRLGSLPRWIIDRFSPPGWSGGQFCKVAVHGQRRQPLDWS